MAPKLNKSLPFRKRHWIVQWLIIHFGEWFSRKPQYPKPHRKYGEQVELLKGRGLVIADAPAAENFLRHVNYYRLSAYSRIYYQSGDSKETFIPGTTFEQVRALYEFDSNLRDLVVAALEPIEVSIRTAMAYDLGMKYGPFGHRDPKNFGRHPRLSHSEWKRHLTREIARSNEVFIQHFEESYREFPIIPIWSSVEIMSFGTLSKMFQLLKTEDQSLLAAPYQIHQDVLGSWLHTIVYVRNICAHHARLWDRDFRVPCAIPRGDNALAWRAKPRPRTNRFGSFLFALNWMNSRSAFPHFDLSSWRRSMGGLIAKSDYGVRDFHFRMGLDASWESHPLWK